MQAHKHRMTITPNELNDCIHDAGFPIEVRPHVIDIVSRGIQGYRDNKTRSYYSPKGKSIKKPTVVHHPPAGRHDQAGARTLLISALCRAWMEGFGQAPTLNNKNGPDSPFFDFAMRIMALEGIGKIHQHLEDYWAHRKKTWMEKDPK
jgi:hypothetical protein